MTFYPAFRYRDDKGDRAKKTLAAHFNAFWFSPNNEASSFCVKPCRAFTMLSDHAKRPLARPPAAWINSYKR